jgi:hypothetical protein
MSSFRSSIASWVENTVVSIADWTNLLEESMSGFWRCWHLVDETEAVFSLLQ